MLDFSDHTRTGTSILPLLICGHDLTFPDGHCNYEEDTLFEKHRCPCKLPKYIENISTIVGNKDRPEIVIPISSCQAFVA